MLKMLLFSSIFNIKMATQKCTNFFFLMHAGRTAVTIQCYKIVSNEVKDNQVLLGASQVTLVVKNPLANSLPIDIRDSGSIPVSGKSPWRRAWQPTQCSCLENPMDREAWWATVHGVAKSWT